MKIEASVRSTEDSIEPIFRKTNKSKSIDDDDEKSSQGSGYIKNKIKDEEFTNKL